MVVRVIENYNFFVFNHETGTFYIRMDHINVNLLIGQLHLLSYIPDITIKAMVLVIQFCFKSLIPYQFIGCKIIGMFF